MSTDPLGVYEPAPTHKRNLPRQAEKGRICAASSCGVKLSVYNPDRLCAGCRRRRRTRLGGNHRTLDEWMALADRATAAESAQRRRLKQDREERNRGKPLPDAVVRRALRALEAADTPTLPLQEAGE